MKLTVASVQATVAGLFILVKYDAIKKYKIKVVVMMVQRADSKSVKSFYNNLLAYIIVNAGLFIVDWREGGEWWFYWTALIWGMVLAIGAVYVFGRAGRSKEGSASK